MGFKHTTVLKKETVHSLKVSPNGVYVDGTLGGGGHSEEILKQLNHGTLIGIDQDRDALVYSKAKFKKYGERFIPVYSNFDQLELILDQYHIQRIDGLVLDLGVSSHQIDSSERGFSYMHDGALDMRMDQSSEFGAYQVVNEYDEKTLARIIKNYGEEKWCDRIARQIVSERPIYTTFELVEVIKKALPASALYKGSHPAKKTFQAIRIEVNHELEVIEQTIITAAKKMRVGGRISVITFHSLEDRIVKNIFRKLALTCTCPPDFPTCVCGTIPLLKVVTRKPIIPSQEELEDNSRARSAKLRVAEKVEGASHG